MSVDGSWSTTLSGVDLSEPEAMSVDCLRGVLSEYGISEQRLVSYGERRRELLQIFYHFVLPLSQRPLPGEEITSKSRRWSTVAEKRRTFESRMDGTKKLKLNGAQAEARGAKRQPITAPSAGDAPKQKREKSEVESSTPEPKPRFSCSISVGGASSTNKKPAETAPASSVESKKIRLSTTSSSDLDHIVIKQKKRPAAEAPADGDADGSKKVPKKAEETVRVEKPEAKATKPERQKISWP